MSKKRADMTDKERVADSFQKVADARPRTGKRPPRVRADRKRKVTRKPNGEFNMGGWRGSENSLAALELHRGRTQVENLPRCAKEGCNQIRVKGSEYCRWHGGGGLLRARRAADPHYKPKRTTVLKSQLYQLIREGVVTTELRRQPVFAECLDVALHTKPAKRDEPSAERYRQFKYWEACTTLALEFVQAWVALQEDNNSQPWIAATQKAHALGLTSRT